MDVNISDAAVPAPGGGDSFHDLIGVETPTGETPMDGTNLPLFDYFMTDCSTSSVSEPAPDTTAPAPDITVAVEMPDPPTVLALFS
jgi:hypothetical protein